MTDRAAPPLDLLLARREWVRRFARTLARDDASADDLEQEAWLAAIEHPPRHADAPAGWLRRVLVNRAIDLSVAGRRRASRETAASRPEATPAAADVVATAEAHRRVVEAVLALDEPYRTTVLLRFFEDLPPREVAQRMDVPVETVRARVRRACERLRCRLDDEHRGARAAWIAPLLAGPAAESRAPADALPNSRLASTSVRLVLVAAGVAAAIVVAWTGLASGTSSSGGGDRDATATASRNAKLAHGDRRRPRAGGALPESMTAGEADAAQSAADAAPAGAAPYEFVVTVVDAQRAPVDGVRVRLDPAEMEHEIEAVSDPRGRAGFEVVGPVRTVTADARGTDGRAWRPRRGFVRVAAGVKAVEYVVERGAWIRGRVDRQDGTPFEFAEVVAVDGARAAATTYADGRGAFEIAVEETSACDLVLTGYSHQVLASTNTPAGRVTQVMDRGFGPTDGEARGVAAGSEGVVLTARRPAGKASLRVLVTTPDGRALAGVPLRIDSDGLGFACSPTTTTDAEGRWVVDDVPSCRVRVWIADEPGRPRPWEGAGCTPPLEPLLARPGETELTVAFHAARAIGGRIETPADAKRRRTEAGTPHPVRIELHADDRIVSVAWTDAADAFVVLAPTAAAGPFRLAASLVGDDWRRYEAALDAVAHGAEDVVLRLSTDDPPPAPTDPAAKPVKAAPK